MTMTFAPLNWLALLAIMTSPVFAATVDQAQSDRMKAFSDLYDALKNSPDPQGQVAALTTKVVGPANDELGRALHQQADESLRKAGATRMDADNAEKLRRGEPIRISGNGKTLDGSATPVGAAPAGHTSTSGSGYHHPEVILDGSKIQREMEFKAPQPTQTALPVDEDGIIQVR